MTCCRMLLFTGFERRPTYFFHSFARGITCLVYLYWSVFSAYSTISF